MSVGGKVNASNLNFAGLDPLNNVADTDFVIISPATGGPNRRALVSQVGGGVPDPLLLQDGTLADPSLAFVNSPATGVFRPGADIFAFAANGVETARMIETGGSPQLILPSVNDVNFPALAFGDGDSGFLEFADDGIRLILAGATFVT